jgi:penicillin-binding protein 1A
VRFARRFIRNRAECEAVTAHIANLQEEFFIQSKTNKNAPFVNISDAETQRILKQAMKSSNRWAVMKDRGKR